MLFQSTWLPFLFCHSLLQLLISSRYDKEGTRALHTEQFFRVCGLDSQGRQRQAPPYTPRGAAYPKSRQRPHSEIGHTDGIDTSTELHKILKQESVDALTDKTKQDIIDVPTGKEVDTAKEITMNDQETERKIEIKKTQKAPPKLDNIIDCLHYRVSCIVCIYIRFVDSNCCRCVCKHFLSLSFLLSKVK